MGKKIYDLDFREAQQYTCREIWLNKTVTWLKNTKSNNMTIVLFCSCISNCLFWLIYFYLGQNEVVLVLYHDVMCYRSVFSIYERFYVCNTDLLLFGFIYDSKPSQLFL